MALNGGYDNVSATLTATESDHDRVVGMPATLLVTEGATSTYTVKLTVQPSSNVRLKVKVIQISNAALTVDTDENMPGNQSEMIFTATTWDTLQTVMVTAARDDNTVDGSAAITTTASSSDMGYNGIPIPSVAVREAETELRSTPPGGSGPAPGAGGATLSASRVWVPEGGAATYTVVLASQPTADVIVAVANRGAPDDDPDLTASPATMTFTPDDWDTPQTVTLSAAQDADALHGSALITHTATSDDAGYDAIAIAEVTATEIDADVARVDVSASRVPVPEGGVNSYTVVLATQPTADVIVAVANRGAPDDDADLTASPATLTFTPDDWDTPQTVTLAAARDADALHSTATFIHTATSDDTDYDAIAIAEVTATEIDADVARVDVSASRVPVPEGGVNSYTVVLATQPGANVVIAVGNRSGPADDADLTASPTTLTFTPDDWDAPQTVTLSGAHDADALNGSALITHTATSDDTGYDAIAIAEVTATEIDDDVARVNVSALNVSVPEGGASSYTVVLATQPAAPVTVAVASRGSPADDADLTVSPTTLIFTPATWDTPQTVTLAGARDADALGGTATFTHTATSADAGYQRPRRCRRDSDGNRQRRGPGGGIGLERAGSRRWHQQLYGGPGDAAGVAGHHCGWQPRRFCR